MLAVSLAAGGAGAEKATSRGGAGGGASGCAAGWGAAGLEADVVAAVEEAPLEVVGAGTEAIYGRLSKAALHV